MKYARRTGYIMALIIFLLVTAGPFIWAFVISVTPDHAMFAPTSDLFPKKIIFDLSHYAESRPGAILGGFFAWIDRKEAEK